VSISRRDVCKAGIAVGGAALASKAFGDGGGSGSTLVSSSGLRSPFVTPWVEPLYIPPVLGSVALTEDPAGSGDFVNTSAGITFRTVDSGHGLAAGYTHQKCSEFKPKKLYQIDLQNANWSFHKELPPAPLFTYNGAIPGPMIHVYYGEPMVIRVNNKLDPKVQGFGMPDTATHLHNMHTASESDGYPLDLVTSTPDPVNHPSYRDQHYCMVRAGCDQIEGTGDPRETLGTLWYHDHRIDFTAQNVYRGLFGFCNAFDETDTGDETGALHPATNLRLPSGAFDIMLGFVDPQFDSSGKIYFDVFDTDGHLGDYVAVNGKIQPFLNVQRRKYRFRLLDIGPSRFYQFFLSKGLPAAGQTTWIPTTLISTDGNLLPFPVPMDNIPVAPAERMDIVVDFSKYNDGDEIYLVNRLQQTSGRGPDYQLMNPGVPVLKFVVQGAAPAPDPSRVPATLRALHAPSAAELASAVHRSWEFARSNGAWTVNGLFFDQNVVRATVKRAPAGQPATTEIWTIKNGGGGWSHPIHIHFEEFQILTRNGAPPPLYERGRKDVVNIHPDEEVKVFFRFGDFHGKYVMHCHNVVHEDHAMMIRFDIVDT
jgi:FtsP/CotA-like multicopper oxidase with cupredoxin domain